MNIEELRAERERIVEEFIQAMNDWLEVFNRYADKIEERKRLEK